LVKKCNKRLYLALYLYTITFYDIIATTNLHWHNTALVLDDELAEGERNLVTTAFFKYASQK